MPLLCKIYFWLTLPFRIFDGFISAAEIPEQIGNQIIGSVHHPAVSLLNCGLVMNCAKFFGNDDFIIAVFMVCFLCVPLVVHVRGHYAKLPR